MPELEQSKYKQKGSGPHPTLPRRRGRGNSFAPSLLSFLLSLLFAFAPPARAQTTASFSYDNAPVRTVITDVQRRTPYRFLYRDALVSDKRITLRADSRTLMGVLAEKLGEQGIDVRVDEARHQVLLVEGIQQPLQPIRKTVRGYVVDQESGARLPLATVTWIEEGRLHGVNTDDAGAFVIRTAGSALDVTASYVGFHAQTVRVEPAQGGALTFRLRPARVLVHDVVVTGATLYSDLDTSLSRMIEPRLRMPFGERSVIRSLQALPSVGVAPAFGDGLNVRGSKSDGFQVLLDGMSIYSQSHFFGLFDAFNADALQAVGLYLGVAPAEYAAPPGGTLSLTTRSGSQTGVHGSAGLSSTAARGTAEVPLLKGRGSLLLSGRRSIMDGMDWLGNGTLVSYGLGVNRDMSELPARVVDPSSAMVRPGFSAADFYDVHAKFQGESGAGRRMTLSLYTGGTDTRQESERWTWRLIARPGQHLKRDSVWTNNRWGNDAASFQVHSALGSRTLSRTLVGFSRYHSAFDKDDYVYVDTTLTGDARNPNRLVTGPFVNRNRLTELKLGQQFDIAAGGAWTTGASLHLFDIRYGEQSLLRRDVAQETRAFQFDAFAQYDWSRKEIALQTGLRSHYFSDGKYLRLSPRVSVRLFPDAPVSLQLGYSRNYQFLHRLYLENTSTSNIWVATTEGQPPSSVKHLTAGLLVRPAPGSLLQVEVYNKRSENLRQHESALWRQSRLVNPAGKESKRNRMTSPLESPWFYDNSAYANGLEVLFRRHLGPLVWTNAYALSRVETQNDLINGGARYPAEWDRTHQFTTSLQAGPVRGFSAQALWVVASGAPNPFAGDPGEPERLAPYHRLDLNAGFQHRLAGALLEGRLSLFNVYDRHNTWYREPVLTVDTSQRPVDYGFVNVDVFDLGFHPSFDVSVTF